jgi:hypothetical protein
VQSAAQISPQDRDNAIRTMIGEEDTPAGQAGVASTMLNRLRSGQYGKSLTQIAHAPGQFESWSRNGKGLSGIPQSDPRYQLAAAIFDGVASGQVPDLTNGATHFYAPKTQTALGRKPPTWATGQTGKQLGNTLFFASPINNGKSAPAVQAINVASGGPDPMKDYEVAPATTSAAPQEPDPMRDYPVAPSTSAPPSSAAPQAANSAREPDPMLDYEVAPAATSAASAVPTQASSGPSGGALEAARVAANGIPIIGGALNRLDAVTNAALAPVLNRFFEPKDQLQGSFSDRYSQSLAEQNARDEAFATAHPVANNLLSAAGAVAGTVPAMVAAPAVFGVGGPGLMVNMLTGAASGAGVDAADSAVRSNGDLGAIERGAKTGAEFGAIGSAAGKLIGSGVNAVSNLLSRTTPAARNVANIFSDIGMTPQQASDALSRMGPNATLADIDPALTQEAGGLASQGGAPTSILKNAMAARAAGVDDRVSQLMDAQLGPAPDVEATLQSVKDAAAKRAQPLYNAGRAGAPMDVTPVLANINSQLPNASGGIKSILNSVRGFLTNDVATKANPLGMTVPKSDPEAILGARQALDDMMYNRATGDAKLGPNAMRVAGDLRNQVDSIVKSNSNFARGDAIYSQAKNVESAFRQGQEIFGTNTRPADLARTLASMPPEQASALRLGARAAIADAMQGARRGEGPAAQGLFSRSANNRANLNLLFPNAQSALDALHAEGMMRATENEVKAGSQTAARRAIQQKYAPPSDTGGIGAAAPIIGEAIGGGSGAAALTAARMAYGNLRNAFTEAGRKSLNEGTARGFAATGSEQAKFLGQVDRAYRTNRVTNALSGGASLGANALTRAAGPVLTPYVVNKLSGAQN